MSNKARLSAYVKPETLAWIKARSTTAHPIGVVIDEAVADAQAHRARETKEIVGYPHVIVRTDDELGQWFVAPEFDEETGCESPSFAYGWHGDDQPPCDGEWIAGLEDGRYGAIVVTDSPEPPDLPDGWGAEDFSEDMGWWYADDSGWQVNLIHHNGVGDTAIFVAIGGGV